MSAFAFLFFCFQTCLIQTVYSQCFHGAYGPGTAGPAFGCGTYDTPAAIAAYPGYAAYGGAGVGDVAVAGEMGVAGTTMVAGQVPILGAVEFGGVVPTAGTVTITGSCGCGCNAGYGPFAGRLAAAAPSAAAAFAYDVAAMSASNGGGLEVASGSTLPPRGVSILSDNAIEGALAVAGAVPFLGTVGLEGALPTVGAGAVNYACGNGVAILAEDIAPVGIANPYGYGPFGSCGYGPEPMHGACGRAGYGAFI